jgi:hypothetical protein
MTSQYNEIIVISSDEEEEMNSPLKPIILSIDVGFKNLGIFMHDPNQPAVLEWKALDLSLSNFQPETIVRGLETALEPYLSLPLVSKNKCVVLIERQTRMLNVHNVGAVDLTLRAWLYGRGIPIETVDPKKVKMHFSISEKNYKKRKAAGVKIATKLMEDWPSSQLSDRLRNQFASAQKKDDMADALLQWAYFKSLEV